jgi:RNA polymerase sigma-70 factor (ECF subfamily)
MSSESQQQNRLRLESWVARYGVPLRAHLFALVRRNDVADDLLQETFRRAWQAVGRYEEQNNERGWLFRLADRTVADHWRKVGRDALVSATDYQSAGEQTENSQTIDPADDAAGPLARMIASEERAEALRWLDALSESQRRVLLLRFFGELEFAEIARHLEVPLGTVLSHAHRGLNQLRTLLAGQTSRERTL